MTKFFTVAAFLLLVILLLLIATNSAGNPAALSTAEYAINQDASLQDRAAERAHSEEMARIAATSLESELEWRTYRTYGVAGIVALGIMAGALVYAAANRPKVIVHRIEDKSGGVTVIEERAKLEVRR